MPSPCKGATPCPQVGDGDLLRHDKAADAFAVMGARRMSCGASGTSHKGQPDAQLALLSMCEVNPHCAITANESTLNPEIRTKVFRIGAPLLRSTIPVPLGRSSTVDS